MQTNKNDKLPIDFYDDFIKFMHEAIPHLKLGRQNNRLVETNSVETSLQIMLQMQEDECAHIV